MSNYCVSCGAPIPDGQNTCSMCFGDLGHGKDGYYREWLRQEEERAREEERYEKLMREQEVEGGNDA